MKNQIRLDANTLPNDKIQVVLTFDKNILLKDKIEGENQLLYVFTTQLEAVTDRALLLNDFDKLPMISNAIN